VTITSGSGEPVSTYLRRSYVRLSSQRVPEVRWLGGVDGRSNKGKRSSPGQVTLSPAVLEKAPNWIMSKTQHSVSSVLQLGYELKKNGEQNAERACRTLDNFYP
jgi:hypothetical protein